jgi:hypothetical protein
MYAQTLLNTNNANITSSNSADKIDQVINNNIIDIWLNTKDPT